MNDVFSAGPLSEVTTRALDRAKAAVGRSKQPSPVAMQHEAVQAGAIPRSLLAWEEVAVELIEEVGDLRVTVRVPVRGGASALAYFPGPLRLSIRDGLGGVQYQGSPWTGHTVVCTRTFDPQIGAQIIDEWRRGWSELLDQRVSDVNELIAKYNTEMHKEVGRLIDARIATWRRIDALTGAAERRDDD